MNLTIFELLNVFLENETTFGFDTGLLPDGVLCEEFVRRWEGGVVVNVGVAFEHVAERRAGFGEASLALFEFFGFEVFGVLR